MINNRIKQAWKNNKPVLNGWLSIANAFVAEILAERKFDSLTIDMQHGVIDYSDAFHMLQAMRSSKVAPMARVPWLEPGIIMKMLDAGAQGIICPMVNNRDQAEKLVSYVRYPPLGTRSFGPVRSLVAYGPSYYNEANENVICMAMVETAEAFANLEEIATTPGLDGIYIGPADLTLGLKKGAYAPGLDREEEDMIEVIKKILVTCKSAGIIAGIHTGSSDYAVRAVNWGFDLVTLLGDVRLLSSYATTHVNEVRDRLGLTEDQQDSDSSSVY